MNHNRSIATASILLGQLIFTALLVSDGSSTELDYRKINKSVVKIFSIKRFSSYSVPWQYKNYNEESTASGAILDGNRIITNAHAVSDSVYIQVKKANDPTKYTASIESIGHDADLAILTVNDPTFFEGTIPLNIGGLPSLQEAVSAYGFPEGGDKVSITKGVVSRIEQTKYVHDGFYLISVQIDAAINSGNSGGPVISNGNLVGIAMQTLNGSDNIGYIIPTPVIKHFLKDVEDSSYEGFPDDGIFIQSMENSTIRKYYGISNRVGCLVSKVKYGSSAYGIIKRGDVILSIDDVPLANDGSYQYNEDVRLDSNHLVRMHYIGEKVKYNLIRNNVEMSISITLQHNIKLVPLEHDKKPTYLIYGGIVMMPLTQNFLFEWGDDWETNAPTEFLDALYNHYPSKDRKQIIFIAMTLPQDMISGLGDLSFEVVDKVNGSSISEMKDLVSIFRSNKDQYIVIETKRGKTVVLDSHAVQSNEKEMKEMFGIEHLVSTDLRN